MASGVYLIICLPTGKRYIGSTVNLKARWTNHRSALRLGKHSNIHLQRAWNKYGADNFGFEVLEEAESAALKDAEERWLYSEKPEFNINPRADAPMRGLKWSAEHRAKISARMKASGVKPPGMKWTPEERLAFSQRMTGHTINNGRVRSPEFRAKVSMTMKGVPKSEETKANMRAAQRKRFGHV